MMQNQQNQISRRMALEELARRSAKQSLLAQMLYCWDGKRKLMVGPHTKAICDRLTRAVADAKQGASTYLAIMVPPRHGKTSIMRSLVAYWMAEMAGTDVIISGYGASLTADTSVAVRDIMRGQKYQSLHPGVLPRHGVDAVGKWMTTMGSTVTATGLGGSLTGHGGSLIVCDDVVKSIAEARSRVYRERTWDSFRIDLMSRLNPGGSLFVLVGTPWHVDDVIARTLANNGKDDFPQFEVLRFPALNTDGTYLHEDRMGKSWYQRQYAMMGSQASALLDCQPLPDGGGRFDLSKIKWVDTPEGFPAIEHRAWDLASSSANRNSSDPDWTVGVRGGITTKNENGILKKTLWIKDISMIRAEAPERDAMIRKTAISDGPSIRQHVEAFGAYKDALTGLQNALSGVSTVLPVRLSGDKTAKAASMEPMWEAGNIVILRQGVKNRVEFDSQVSAFPNGKHDDIVDAMAILWHVSGGPSGGYSDVRYLV